MSPEPMIVQHDDREIAEEPTLVAVVAQPTGFDRMQVEALDLVCGEDGSDVGVGAERQHACFRTGADDGQARRFDRRPNLRHAAGVADGAAAHGRRPGQFERVEPDDRIAPISGRASGGGPDPPFGCDLVQYGRVQVRQEPHEIAQRLVEILDRHEAAVDLLACGGGEQPLDARQGWVLAAMESEEVGGKQASRSSAASSASMTDSSRPL